VVEGRDRSSVVYGESVDLGGRTIKNAERASRRSKEMLEMHYDQVAADIARRDHADASRAASPLAPATDAVHLDTTGRSVEEVVGAVLDLAAAAGWQR
jgi:cytidylate kinase